MRREWTLPLLFLVACSWGAGPAAAADLTRSSAPEIVAPELAAEALLERIAFRSCLHQAGPQPIFGPLLADAPNLLQIVDPGRVVHAQGVAFASVIRGEG